MRRTFRRWAWLVAMIGVVPALSRAQAADADGAFVVKPYLQWGEQASGAGSALLWHTDDVDASWLVEVRQGNDSAWTEMPAPMARKVAVSSIAPHRVYRALLTGLATGAEFDYRVKRGGAIVFSSHARARKGADQPYRFVVYGDCAAGTAGQKAIAFQVYRAEPDFVFITGDIVYQRGRISEYRDRFYPVYNADTPSLETGAPLLRSTWFLAAPGNHDIATRDLALYPDALAYFLYWSQPLNGPISQEGARFSPTLQGPESRRRAFLEAAGPTYPKMANFSFDYAGAHWTVLDANTYVDWTDPALVAWLESDLAAASTAAWRFVAFHQPGFNSSRKHFDEQRMRLLAPVFEKHHVDVVFTGHVHNYQRSYPMRFVPRTSSADRKGRVDGTWTLDRSYDGQTRTRPSGVVYLVTGAGGANLYDPEQETDRASWQEFTYKFLSKLHSFTIVDVSGNRLNVRQVSVEGKELDRFRITR